MVTKLKKKVGGNGASLEKLGERIFATRFMSSEFQKAINIKHTKGCLLYGPPGTGKTLLAR